MLLTTDSKQQAFFRIKKFHVRILYIKRAIIGGWDLASDTPILLLNFSQANCVWACEICKTGFLSMNNFFKFSNFMWNEIITKSFRPTVLYINLGQIYNIQPCCNTYDPFVPFFVCVPGVLVPGQADRHKGLSWMTGEEYLLPTLFWYGHLLLHAHNKMSISEKKLHVNLTLIVLSKTNFQLQLTGAVQLPA